MFNFRLESKFEDWFRLSFTIVILVESSLGLLPCKRLNARQPSQLVLDQDHSQFQKRPVNMEIIGDFCCLELRKLRGCICAS